MTDKTTGLRDAEETASQAWQRGSLAIHGRWGLLQYPGALPPPERNAWVHLWQHQVLNEDVAAQPTRELIRRVETRLSAIEKRLDAIDSGSIQAFLSVVPGLRIHQPIPVVVVDEEEDSIARWVEAGLVGIASSEGGALDSLRREIRDVCVELSSLPADRLTRTTLVMRNVIAQYAEPEK